MKCEFDSILSYLETQEKIINEKESSHVNIENSLKSKKTKKSNKPKIKPKNKSNENNNIICNNNVRGFNSDKFVSLMRSELIKNDKSYKNFRSKEYLSVTELYKCPRQVYYSRKNFLEIKYVYPNLLLIQDIGKAIHKTIQKVYPFEKCEDTIKSEKYKIKGKFDGFVDNSIVELKSIGRDKYTGTYLVDHYYQGTIYAHILNHEYGYHIDNISIVYIIRDLKDKKPPVFNLKPNDLIAEKFLNRALLIHKCLATNTPPPSIKSEINCQWCPFKKQCKSDGDSGKIVVPKPNKKQSNITKTKKIKSDKDNKKPIKSKKFEAKFLL